MNWGKGITIFMIGFIGFIGSMVFYAFTRNADLIREDYYEQEAFYEQGKTNRWNYQNSNDPVNFTLQQNALVFHFPSTINTDTPGKIKFYRPDQMKLDREFQLAVNEQHEQELGLNFFEPGYYDLQVEWSDGNRSYLFEDNISF